MNYQIDEIISCYAVDKNGTRTPIEFGKISNIEAECSLDGSKQVSITIPPNEVKGEMITEKILSATLIDSNGVKYCFDKISNVEITSTVESFINKNMTVSFDVLTNDNKEYFKIDTQITELDLLDDQELKIF
jgi:hypothetical protein